MDMFELFGLIASDGHTAPPQEMIQFCVWQLNRAIRDDFPLSLWAIFLNGMPAIT
jgi:hypothetical protein